MDDEELYINFKTMFNDCMDIHEIISHLNISSNQASKFISAIVNEDATKVKNIIIIKNIKEL